MTTKHALIVEDASNWAKQHQLSLSELGFETSVANDYPEALGLLRRHRFDLAVIDLCLTTDVEPENLDGVFLLDYLVEKNIPVIIVTGRGYRQLVDELYRGFDVFEILDKLHFDPDKFKQYVVEATRTQPESASANEQKRALSREKIENLILTLIRNAPTQPRQLDPPLPAIAKAQHLNRLRVFISHSNKDKPLADKLANDLRTAGLDLWYDRDEIQVGDTILEKIGQGLAKCDYMIIILSPEAVGSWMVRQELLIFLNEEMRRGHRLVLPVLYKDCPIPLLLEGRRYADFRENYDTGVAELLNSLGLGEKAVERIAQK